MKSAPAYSTDAKIQEGHCHVMTCTNVDNWLHPSMKTVQNDNNSLVIEDCQLVSSLHLFASLLVVHIQSSWRIS